MPPPMTSASTMSSSASITPSLSRDLRPAEHRDERPRRVPRADRAAPRPPGRAAARRRVGRRLRRPDDRGVRPVRRAERVVDVDVEARRPAGRRRPGRWPPRPGRSAGSRAARRPARARPSRARTGATEYFGIGLALGPAEVGARGDLRAVRPAATRSSGSAARMRRSSVIAPSSERDVEVGAQQHPLPVEGRQVLEDGTTPVGHATGWRRRRCSTRSTSRFE